MANQLSMAKINAIQTLHQSGHSNCQIAKLLLVRRQLKDCEVRVTVDFAT